MAANATWAPDSFRIDVEQFLRALHQKLVLMKELRCRQGPRPASTSIRTQCFSPSQMQIRRTAVSDGARRVNVKFGSSWPFAL